MAGYCEPQRIDPYRNFKFKVRRQQLNRRSEQVQRTQEDHRRSTGTRAAINYTHRLPGKTSYDAILSRGVT